MKLGRQSVGTLSRFVLPAVLGYAMLPGIASSQTASPNSPPETTSSDARLVGRITARMRGNLQRLPNYTCTETIQRSRFDPNTKVTVDNTLRLEVALIDGEEIFALPGSSEFQDSDLRNLIRSGTYGSGAFGLYAKILFLDSMRPELQPRGSVKLEDLKGGAEVLKYDFTVPRDWNKFSMTVGDVRESVGFAGSIYVDPDSLDLRRIHVHLIDLPPELDLSSASDQVDYDSVKIGDEKFLLPVANELTIASPEIESRNQVRFEECRKFQGKATISFLDPEELEAQETQQVQEVTLPERSTLEILLDTKLDVSEEEKYAVGDIITGKLDQAVRVKGKELIPKGATVTGRIVQLDRYPSYYALQVRFTDIGWKGGHASVHALLYNLGFPAQLRLPRNSSIGLVPVRNAFGTTGENMIMISKPAPDSLRGLLTRWKSY